MSKKAVFFFLFCAIVAENKLSSKQQVIEENTIIKKTVERCMLSFITIDATINNAAVIKENTVCI